MTKAEFVQLLTPLVIAFRQEWDQPTWTVWFNRLKDQPVVVVKAAVDAVTSDAREFPPTPGQFLYACQVQRAKLVESLPFSGCENCTGTGWQEVEDADGVTRATRCACWRAWQQQLQEAGLVTRPQLTAAKAS